MSQRRRILRDHLRQNINAAYFLLKDSAQQCQKRNHLAVKRCFYEKLGLVKDDFRFSFIGHLFLILFWLLLLMHVVLHLVSIRTPCEPLARCRLRSNWRSGAGSFESALSKTKCGVQLPERRGVFGKSSLRASEFDTNGSNGHTQIREAG